MTRQFEVITPRILLLFQECGQQIAVERPEGKWWPRQLLRVLPTVFLASYILSNNIALPGVQESPSLSTTLLGVQASPSQRTKRTIYEQNENIKRDLQQSQHPKWSLCRNHPGDTELFLSFYFWYFPLRLLSGARVWAGAASLLLDTSAAHTSPHMGQPGLSQ